MPRNLHLTLRKHLPQYRHTTVGASASLGFAKNKTTHSNIARALRLSDSLRTPRKGCALFGFRATGIGVEPVQRSPAKLSREERASCQRLSFSRNTRTRMALTLSAFYAEPATLSTSGCPHSLSALSIRKRSTSCRLLLLFFSRLFSFRSHLCPSVSASTTEDSSKLRLMIVGQCTMQLRQNAHDLLLALRNFGKEINKC